MCASDFRVLRKMDVRCSVFKLLLFQMVVVWCAAKHVTLEDLHRVPQVEVYAEDLQQVQDSIRNLVHTGIYSHNHLDTSAVQVVTPVKVTHDGALVSRAVDHAHAHGHARARRDLLDREHTMRHELHYNLTVDGRELRLDLRPSVTFITPALMIERHRDGLRTRERPRADSTSCHYTGVVRGQPDSAVALSACDGLAGLLRTNHGEYWIEPSNQKPTDHSEGRPHVIFKRSAVDKVNAYERARGNQNRNHADPRQRYRGEQQQLALQNVRNHDAIRRNRENKEAMDRSRRQFLEERRKRLELLRRNPTEYRRQQSRLRLEQRRKNWAGTKSVEASKSFEAIHTNNNEVLQSQNKHQNNNVPIHQKRIRNRARRRRRRAKKNCATKQPPYQWKQSKTENDKLQNYGSQKKNQRNSNQNKWRQENSRRTRSVSKPRHVEVLLVADRSMTDFHNEGNLETYLLTIMNMVSSLYMDPSIGNYIKIVVVKIIMVENVRSSHDLNVTTNADATLESFCRWQQTLNPRDDTNPHHHDVAILVTRQDICSQHDTPCSTLGVAHVAGMCKPDRSCSVNEDNGIMLAHTITHELGHNFGLYHDTEKIGCHRREGSTLHIMTPIFEPDTVQVAWSRCSKRDVTNFLDAGLGECLSDRPSQEEYVYPVEPAGVTFDAATQCHLQFGAESVVCSKPSELCEVLWCLVNNTCISMLRAAAPGTTCGHEMWCQNQTCVPRTPSPQPRDGGWGPWGAWSECSRTCGAGVSTQSRECNNPEPLNNGNYCIGERSQYKVCNMDPCPISEPSFREMQCSKYNNMPFNNETITEWVPYFDQDKPCDLTCVPKSGDQDLDIVGGFVIDGTPCRQSPGSKDMCIAGVCYKVGCDWVVDSDMDEDACGVCGGNGSACKTVQGIYNKESGSGLSEVAVIPAGSRNVKIQEKVSPRNYISIASAKSRKIYLNGARNATLTEYFVAGTQAIYERGRDWEKVNIPGPLAEDIKVYQRIYGGKHRNPGVTYQYTVDRQRPRRRRLHYRVAEWSRCSVTCGDGLRRRQLECVDERGRVVEQSQCYHIEEPRSVPRVQQCREPACPPPPPAAAPPAPAAARPRPPRPRTAQLRAPHTDWWIGSWHPCAKHCHMPGEQVMKRREVYCVNKKLRRVVEDAECNIVSKPIGLMPCGDLPPC